MKPFHHRYNREHWVTSTLALYLWSYAEAAEWDGMLSHNSNAWVPPHWRWERPLLYAAIVRVARRVGAAAWDWVAWHFERSAT